MYFVYIHMYIICIYICNLHTCVYMCVSIHILYVYIHMYIFYRIHINIYVCSSSRICAIKGKTGHIQGNTIKKHAACSAEFRRISQTVDSENIRLSN